MRQTLHPAGTGSICRRNKHEIKIALRWRATTRAILIARFCPLGAVCFRLVMIFPGHFVSDHVSRVPATLGDLELDALF